MTLNREREIEIEAAAIELLQDFGLNRFPVSIAEVARALGVELIPYTSLPGSERDLAFAASCDAFHVRTHDFMNVCIVFDDAQGTLFNRSRFSGGHEIGHIVLEHKEGMPDCEREADYFAGYLLAPHPLVLKCRSNFSLSEVFGVSGECASFAYDQAQIRLREGGPLRSHEKWLLEKAVWRGGGLLGKF